VKQIDAGCYSSSAIVISHQANDGLEERKEVLP